MHGEDIPQAERLETIREAMRAISANEAASVSEVSVRTGVSKRHVSYRLNAARVLGWLREESGRFTLTEAGAAFLRAAPDSEEELDCFRQAIRTSTFLEPFAAYLAGEEARTRAELAAEIQEFSGLAAATADRRAGALQAWRSHFARQPSLFELGRVEEETTAALEEDEPAPPLRLVQVENYGPLQNVAVSLGRFQVVVGRNATGKTSFFDALAFLQDALRNGVAHACGARARSSFDELLWYRQGGYFQIGVEVNVPVKLRPLARFGVLRYELRVGLSGHGRPGVLREVCYLRQPGPPPMRIVQAEALFGWRRLFSKHEQGRAWLRAEQTEWTTQFDQDSDQLLLSGVSTFTGHFPAACYLRQILINGVQKLFLQPEKMKDPCSPLLGSKLLPDGANFASVVLELQQRDPERFEHWVEHLREALRDVEGVQVVERQEDRHRYLKLRYADGLELEAWRLSEGTLRMIALTLIAFLSAPEDVFLIEEPENGVHPQALEPLHEALSGAYVGQVIVATHSPLFVGMTQPHSIVCFTKERGATVITPWSDNDILQQWDGSLPLGDLFASGVF